ncbi:methyltransferase type 11 [Streptomyces rimosus subsp. pseudoverticillatus]|uniref:class I SAM-dependent methyltransferase n=1 Tax=Streptomyces rimosus TaxID=1927 RepID=UPI0006B26084|nr:class I SAM-dependent methyltransferase [Streptomyces rimosus]KOT79241.1 methyltransferase type 11 [Streptomyces rimosus subsp. pseudoverticillatus]
MPDRRTAERAIVHHPVFAHWYACFADHRAGLAGLRREMLAGLSGRVIEIGAGTGANFAHYPRSVAEVVAIEPERTLRRRALTEAARAGIPVDVVPATAEALPVKSEAFDAAVVSLVLCSVRDVQRSLSELRRVLRPGGELRYLEHGRSRRRGPAAVQQALDRTVWPLLMGNCHLARDPLNEIRAAGFAIGPYRRGRLLRRDPGPALPWTVVGVARRAEE